MKAPNANDFTFTLYLPEGQVDGFQYFCGWLARRGIERPLAWAWCGRTFLVLI